MKEGSRYRRSYEGERDWPTDEVGSAALLDTEVCLSGFKAYAGWSSQLGRFLKGLVVVG